MLKPGFSESRRNSKFVRCVLRPPYSIEYFEFAFYGKIAFSRTERVKVCLKGINFRE